MYIIYFFGQRMFLFLSNVFIVSVLFEFFPFSLIGFVFLQRNLLLIS